MPKRMTDTEKWRHHWFKKLTVKQKLLWLYVLDSCTKEGIWPVDLGLASYQAGIEFEIDDFIPIREKGVSLPGERLFLPDFIRFQYGVLRESCHPHRTVIQGLREIGVDPNTLKLSDTLTDTLINRVQDKEEEKDKEKEEEKDKDGRTIVIHNGRRVHSPAWDRRGA